MALTQGLRLVGVADLITAAAAACGVLAVASLLGGGGLTLGTGLVVVALVLDGVDGAAARRFGSKHSRGPMLDSLADAISFCVAPGVLLWVALSGPLRRRS